MLQAQDWSHVRGPDYTGVSQEHDLLETWPADGPTVLWTLDLGTGYSGFVASGKRLYTQTQYLYGQYLICIDRDSGKPVWQYKYDWPYQGSGLYPGPRATPTLDGEHVYFASTSGLVGCVTADDGTLVWSRNLKEEFDGKGTDFGFSSTPLVIDDKVVFPVGGLGASVVALDKSDGNLLWKTGNDPASYCGILPIHCQGHPLLVAFLQNSLTIHNAKTGQTLHRTGFSAGYDEHAAYPLYQDPYLFIASPFRGGGELLKLTLLLEDEKPVDLQVKTHWLCDEMSNDVASSVLLDKHIFGFDLRDVQSKLHRPSRGTFRCIDLATGKPTWSSEEPGHATVAVGDGKLFLLNDQGELFMVRATPERYELMARAKVFSKETCWTVPTLHDGRLYLRSPSRAVCLLVSASETAPVTTSSRLKLAEVAGRSTSGQLGPLLVGGEREYAFDAPDLAELNLGLAFSLALGIVPALILAASAQLVMRLRGSQNSIANSRVIFWAGVMLFGVLATRLGNEFCDEFVFTWHLSLFVAYQTVVAFVVWRSVRKPARGHWWGRLLGLLFAGTCLLYFHLCNVCGLSMQWVFLLGLAFALPITLLTARQIVKRRSLVLDAAWCVAGFFVFHWSAAIYVVTQMTVS